MICRFRVVRQRGERAGSDPGNERFPDRHETAEGPTKTIQGRVEALLADVSHRS